MKALESLAREHAAIGGMVERLELVVDAAARAGEIDGEALERFLAFFEQQVDGHHQEKEERVLLPAVMARACGEDSVLARTLLGDHGAEREWLALMRGNVEGAAYGEPTSLAEVVRHARRYIQHQREHARWEQSVLFGLAERVLEREDQHTILRGFRQLDEVWGTSVVAAARSLARWFDQRVLLDVASR